MANQSETKAKDLPKKDDKELAEKDGQLAEEELGGVVGGTKPNIHIRRSGDPQEGGE